MPSAGNGSGNARDRCGAPAPGPPAVGPSIGQLSNRQFRTEMDRLVDVLYTDVRVRAGALYCCGCGREVAASRKFVNQAHYNVWLSRERFVGPHLRSVSVLSRMSALSDLPLPYARRGIRSPTSSWTAPTINRSGSDNARVPDPN
jgi:hypothetical protein